MDILNVTKNFTGLIKKAGSADENELKLLRKNVIRLVDTIGAKNFVNLAADILKKNFCAEGCDNLRLPLKRIFSLSLAELEEALLHKKYSLVKGHPIYALSEDHKGNVAKLKALDLSLEKINKHSSPGEVGETSKETEEYYRELDLHIRKEEEILFLRLEKSGMSEHPDSLRNEHKDFREIFSKVKTAFLQKDLSALIEAIAVWKEKFIPNIANHIFRETYIFYPAALEFIRKKEEWEDIKKEFALLV